MSSNTFALSVSRRLSDLLLSAAVASAAATAVATAAASSSSCSNIAADGRPFVS